MDDNTSCPKLTYRTCIRRCRRDSSYGVPGETCCWCCSHRRRTSNEPANGSSNAGCIWNVHPIQNRTACSNRTSSSSACRQAPNNLSVHWSRRNPDRSCRSRTNRHSRSSLQLCSRLICCGSSRRADRASVFALMRTRSMGTRRCWSSRRVCFACDGGIRVDWTTWKHSSLCRSTCGGGQLVDLEPFLLLWWSVHSVGVLWHSQLCCSPWSLLRYLAMFETGGSGEKK